MIDISEYENEHLKSINYQTETRYNDLKEKTNYLIYHLNKIIKKLPEFIQNLIDRLFNYNNIDIKFFKQQYDPEFKKKEESLFKGFNLFNKKEIDKTTKYINDAMHEYAEKFYETKKNKEKDNGFER